MGGKRRDRAAEQAAITAAAERLLAATPLRSATGKLTVSELITESGLRRDIACDHPHLIDAFKARVKAKDTAPAALTALAGERDDLRSQLTAAKDELARERHAASILRKLAAELSLELDQAREELTAAGNVTPLRAAHNTTPARPPGTAPSPGPRADAGPRASVRGRPPMRAAPDHFLCTLVCQECPVTPGCRTLRDRVPPGSPDKPPARRNPRVPQVPCLESSTAFIPGLSHG